MPSGNSTAVVSAASELILKPNAIVTQITVSTRPSGQCSANTMPAAVLLPLGMLYTMGPGAYAWASVVIALLLFWRHRVNIRQLLSGRERPIGQ